MQIDRSRFLLLTASIAGGACSSGSSSTSGGTVVVAAPVVALPGAEAATTAAPRTASTAKSGQATVVSADDDKLASLERSPGAGDDGAMCDEGGVPPTGCNTLRAPGPQCESFADTRMMCGKLARGLRPRVAEKVVDCILAKSGKQSVCDFNLANQCGISAIQKGCVEAASQTTCAPLVRKCGGTLQMRDCQALLSSVTNKNRRNMIACMTEGCSVDYCMYDVE